jgi:hypothetical protein
MSQVKSIKCTNCAAPLDLLGGGRVETITCSYCKSTLDLNDNYKVLTNFKRTKAQQDLPFKIGMKGELKGIEYTIIGLISYQSIEYPLSEWTDFLLFSPLYGYAYLTYEEGHLIYSKRNRTFPNTPWHKIPKQGNIMVDGRSYEPFDTYGVRVKYVEGELTWVAKQDDKSSVTDLVNPPYGISIEKTKHELEHYESEYLESDGVYEAFNIEKEPKAKNFHILQPFERPFLKSLSLISFWVLFVIALFAVVATIDGSGTNIQSVIADNTKTQNVDFTVNTTKYLVDLELRSSSSKTLNNFKLEIHKNNKIIFSITPSAAYLFSEETGQVEKKLHPWEKESTKVRVALNLEKVGTYQLRIEPLNNQLNSKLFVTIKEGSSHLNYLAWFFVMTMIFWLIYKFLKWRYYKKFDEERGIENSDRSFNNTYLVPIALFTLAVIIVSLIDTSLLFPLIFISIIVLSMRRSDN